MKNLKFVVLFMAIIIVLPILGCPGGGTGGTGGTTARIITQAPCSPNDLTLEITDIKNNGRAGTYWDIQVSYTVKCAGEGIAADLYLMLAGFPWQAGSTGTDGKGSKTFAPSSDPTGDVITVKIYANDDAENPAQTKTVTVPAP